MENALSYSARSDPTWIESRNWDQPDSENRYVYRFSLAIELDEARAAREDDAAGALEERGDEFFAEVKGFVSDKGWRFFTGSDGGRLLSLDFSVTNTTLRVLIAVSAREECLTIMTTLPIICGKEYRPVMASCLNILNGSLRYGGFRLDENDGEVTFCYSYSFMRQGFIAEQLEQYLFCCINTPDNNYQTIAKIATGSFSGDDGEEGC